MVTAGVAVWSVIFGVMVTLPLARLLAGCVAPSDVSATATIGAALGFVFLSVLTLALAAPGSDHLSAQLFANAALAGVAVGVPSGIVAAVRLAVIT